MVNFGLKNQYVNSLATSPGKKLFAATDSGLYYSNDNGTRWMDMSAGLPNTPLLSVLVSSTDLFVGTAGNNVWHRPLSDFPRFESVDQTQPDLTLSISPNPTTGIITVYNVPANIVHVGVTNVLGETIIELTNSGTADFTIDVSKLMPGTYFAKFSSASEVITRKIIKE
jgi:hypothetical protein